MQINQKSVQNLFKKYWYRLTNKKYYHQYKNTVTKQKNYEIFKSNFENYINEIQKKINIKKELSFLHSGHIGDIINVLDLGENDDDSGWTYGINERTKKCGWFANVELSL